MQLAADAVVFLTGLPIGGALILDGVAVGRSGEVEAGLIIVALLGLPSVIHALRQRLNRE